MQAVANAVSRHAGYGTAVLSRVKGKMDREVIQAFLRYMKEACLIGKIRFRTDSEASIRSLAMEVARQRQLAGWGETLQETTPVGSSSSLGAGEC